eukprot:TRINITY_DN700_c0_g1_i2.p2 TRINITY_DN700_c0_g1~~TRINITY_DN700_c0_g1_i2.p2  ORF type:complete len:111 (-),score=18.07 TRINITY_DN700_c0_g1_i2:125-457(-)
MLNAGMGAAPGGNYIDMNQARAGMNVGTNYTSMTPSEPSSGHLPGLNLPPVQHSDYGVLSATPSVPPSNYGAVTPMQAPSLHSDYADVTQSQMQAAAHTAYSGMPSSYNG